MSFGVTIDVNKVIGPKQEQSTKLGASVNVKNIVPQKTQAPSTTVSKKETVAQNGRKNAMIWA